MENKKLKNQARGATSYAIRMGRLVNPDKCSDCGKADDGSIGKSIIQAHHEDYNFPLDVMWLCTGCHGLRHHEINQTNHPVKREHVDINGVSYGLPVLRRSRFKNIGLAETVDCVDDRKCFNNDTGLSEIVESLPGREMLAVKMKYGFKGKPEFTCDDIGRVIGVTGSRAQQILAAAIQRLRNKIKTQKALAI